MERQKRGLQVLAIGLCAVILCATTYIKQPEMVQIEDEYCALGDSVGTLITSSTADEKVMPDKYNTGAEGYLSKVGLGDSVNGIQLIAGNNATQNVFDFALRNKEVQGVITFNNIDFSQWPVTVYREDQLDREIKLVFENCKFSIMTTGKGEYPISYEFNNCTINSFVGSNATFNNCMFGNYYKDGMVPFQNVEVNNCYFRDLTSIPYEGASELHSDGTQIYGYKDIDVKNVTYNNCRFEVPSIENEGNNARVNACIMLQLEYSNAKNVLFKDCTVNGGGYSIYAWDKNLGYSFENVTFDNIKIGGASRFGSVFMTVSPGVILRDLTETDALYIGTVWKEDSNTHFSVTNDTDDERKLVVITGRGEYEFIIPACPDGEALQSGITFEEMPFDIDISIPEDCKYAICYDATTDGMAKQIRFVNWKGDKVYLSNEVFNQYFNSEAEKEVIASGTCGPAVSYKLTKGGVLQLEGEGKTYDYNSKKLAPWAEYIADIKEVQIAEGIDVLGTQIFINHASIVKVTFPDSLKEIRGRAFMKCSALLDITLPAGIEEIGGYAFYGAMVQRVSYEGTPKQWAQITIGEKNNDIAEKVSYVEKTEKEESKEQETGITVLSEGVCGKNANYVLYSNGELRITGTGNTYNYNSSKTAPWYELRDTIINVVVEEGIEELGTQSFRMCSNLRNVNLPGTLKIIGGNAFIKCTNLDRIIIPAGVVGIGDYAFAGTGICRAIYLGDMLQWESICVGIRNECILNNLTVL